MEKLTKGQSVQVHLNMVFTMHWSKNYIFSRYEEGRATVLVVPVSGVNKGVEVRYNLKDVRGS